MPAVKNIKKISIKFTIDCKTPVDDQIFDMPAFEKYLQDRVKVNGHTNCLADGGIKIERAGDKINFTSTTPVSKRSLKYLTKKFMKKHQLSDWLRVISTDKQTYTIKYFDMSAQEEAAEDEE